jgi:hypothetical protein
VTTTTPQFEYVLYDIEGDGLFDTVTKLWCAVMIDLPTGVTKGYRPAELEQFVCDLSKAKLRVGHNILDYDDPTMNKLHGIWLPPETAVDTLVMSRLFYPDRPGGHSLKSWGIRLGCHKGDFDDFSQFTEEMYEYCLQDGNVNLVLLNYFLKNLKWTLEDLVKWRLKVG